jgi:hypothetical protein
MRTITLQQLIDAKACPQQVELFRKHFGESVRVTVPKARKYAQAFSWDFAARHFLDASALKAYDEATASAWEVYRESTASARKAYREAPASASARKAYDGVIASARKAYDEVIASARKTYDEVIASARKAYSEVVAVAFAAAYLSQEETK